MDIPPKPAPDLGIPQSNKVVTVRAIDTTTRLVCNTISFVEPAIPGHEKLNATSLCFLVDHESSSNKEYVLFDLGARKDFWNGSPRTKKNVSGMVGLKVDYGVDEILIMKGFELKHLKAILLSHWHFDHIGDCSKFPGSTDLVVGPGFKEEFIPGYPENPEGLVLASDVNGRRVYEPDFNLDIGGFRAHDYFGDGSFYLLDVPGHAVGHICGLARTTPDTFVFMGADCCHFPGAYRPTQYKPLPATIPTEQLDSSYPSPCPCSIFTDVHPFKQDGTDPANPRTRPFYNISQNSKSSYKFSDIAQHTADRLQIFDACDNIFICLAHDTSLFTVLPLFNDNVESNINDWKVRRYKEDTRWSFLNELPKQDQPGREPLVVGLRRNGKLIEFNSE